MAFVGIFKRLLFIKPLSSLIFFIW